jgi:ElaB/YqjD/DUF883 family membrane-anchored ribosome-binding protein
MGQDASQERTAVEPPTPEDLRREIEQTREDLGDTAAALAAKTDVKARAKDKAQDLKQSAAAKAESLKQSAAEKTESVTSDAAADGSSSNSSIAAKACAAARQGATTARENPVPTAAGAMFVVGFLLGRRGAR